MDNRIEKLAKLLVDYSMRIAPGENCLIDYSGSSPKELIKALVRAVYAAGGRPYVQYREPELQRELLLRCSEEQVSLMSENELAFMEKMQAYVAVRASDNNAQFSDVPPEKMAMYNRLMQPVLDRRVGSTKWVVLRYPNDAMAQLADMSTEAFRDFYFDVCTMDYAKMDRAMDALKARMDAACDVHILGPDTDLRFSIEGMPAIKCSGLCNIPDGEVYTAPVRESMNGYIHYNTPSPEMGFTYENVRFEIENGRIVKAVANDSDRIQHVLDTDEGARYFGEFALGVNPFILKPIKNILFDEKICGSFHLTPGMAYEDADNGNRSAIHWDLVMIQRPECGGGEIWFDGELIRKDGLFVPADLQCLNPDNLK